MEPSRYPLELNSTRSRCRTVGKIDFVEGKETKRNTTMTVVVDVLFFYQELSSKMKSSENLQEQEIPAQNRPLKIRLKDNTVKAVAA
jgi:hypothetical protein